VDNKVGVNPAGARGYFAAEICARYIQKKFSLSAYFVDS